MSRLRLQPHRHALETCVYCPKLCRATCPVSNVEASETLTPWGKMSLAYFLHRGDVPCDAEHAQVAWACTGCLACRQRCEHRNEVAHVLRATRAEAWRAHVQPAPARGLVERWPAHLRRLDAAAAAIESEGADGRVVVLVGCALLRHSPAEALAAVRVTEWLVGGRVRLVRGCCGLPLLEAGDRSGFEQAARTLCEQVQGAERLLVVEPGCARTLLEEYPRVGAAPGRVELLVDGLAAELERIPARALQGERLRVHDSCQLARPLGRSALPRRILERLTGTPPAAFVRSGEQSECCGAGGLLPLTHPATSGAIARERIEEHHAAGGGQLVTTCGGSLHRLRTAGEPVQDWLSLLAHALGLATTDSTAGGGSG